LTRCACPSLVKGLLQDMVIRRKPERSWPGSTWMLTRPYQQQDVYCKTAKGKQNEHRSNKEKLNNFNKGK